MDHPVFFQLISILKATNDKNPKEVAVSMLRTTIPVPPNRLLFIHQKRLVSNSNVRMKQIKNHQQHQHQQQTANERAYDIQCLLHKRPFIR